MNNRLKESLIILQKHVLSGYITKFSVITEVNGNNKKKALADLTICINENDPQNKKTLDKVRQNYQELFNYFLDDLRSIYDSSFIELLESEKE